MGDSSTRGPKARLSPIVLLSWQPPPPKTSLKSAKARVSQECEWKDKRGDDTGVWKHFTVGLESTSLELAWSSPGP